MPNPDGTWKSTGFGHPLEEKWGVPAATILDAIDGSIDLIQRGVRGVLAEHQFKKVLTALPPPWQIVPDSNHSTDYALTDGHGGLFVTIQVKMQRLTKGAPLLDKQGHPMVETQKSRFRGAGRHRTNLYEYGDFDILAVSLWPSTGNWDDFLFAPQRLLQPAVRRRGFIAGYQSVIEGADPWSRDLLPIIEQVAGKHAIRETEMELDLGV